MSEHELREGLALAVVDEPPLALNLDDLVTTAERMVRRRRALVAVGTSTALIAVAAVTVPVVLGIAPGGGPAELPVAAPPTTVTTPPDRTSVAYLTERGKQMRAYLLGQFPKVVPAATDVEVSDFGGEAEGQISAGQKYLTSTVRYTVAGQRTAIMLQIDTDVDPSAACAACEPRPQPDGTKVQLEATDMQGNKGNDIVRAMHIRTNGTTVSITTYDYDPSGPAGEQRPQLTVDQIVHLATDPNLRI
jgi:hypothetical protein